MSSPPAPPPRLELCGGLGVGKSTLAAAIAARFGVPVIAERFEDVPGWAAFYADPAAHAFEKNLGFLLAHAEVIRGGQARGSAFACDFAFFQTISYSAAASAPADTAAIRHVHDRLAARLGPPALLLRLRCPPDVHLARIQARGRAPEQAVDLGYLARLEAAVDAEIARLGGAVPVVEVEATLPDPLGDPALATCLAALFGSAATLGGHGG